MLKTCLFVSYTCSLFRDGYMLKGNNTTQCFFGNWTGMTPWCKEGNFFWINQSKRWGGRHIMPLLLLFRKCWKTKQVRKRTAAKECAVANPFSCLICGKEAKRVLRSFDNSCPKLRTLVLWISRLIIDHDLLLINRLVFCLISGTVILGLKGRDGKMLQSWVLLYWIPLILLTCSRYSLGTLLIFCLIISFGYPCWVPSNESSLIGWTLSWISNKD